MKSSPLPKNQVVLVENLVNGERYTIGACDFKYIAALRNGDHCKVIASRQDTAANREALGSVASQHNTFFSKFIFKKPR